MLLDPLEEEFHLPAAFVERADGGGRKREVVGDEDQRLAELGVLEADAPQKFGVILMGVEAVQGDGLVANDAGRAIRRRRIDAMSIDVRLGTRDEEGPGLVQHIKAGKVDVATIHDVDGSGFRQEHIEGMNVVQLAIRDSGGYLDTLVPKLRRAMVPVATYVIATEPLGEKRMHDVIRVPYSISDNKFANDYYRRLPDSRILWGGRISVRQSGPPDLSALMRKDLLKVYPQLKGVRIESAWHGLMSYAVHKMPQVGQLSAGVWYAMGSGGHGMNTTNMAGDLVASAISSGDDRYRLFEPFGLTPSGGPIGAAAAQLTYWYFQLKDVVKTLREV